jgi:hypothetical protein
MFFAAVFSGVSLGAADRRRDLPAERMNTAGLSLGRPKSDS